MPAQTDPQAIVPIRFGGHVALDFVNTVDSWIRPPTRNYVDDFDKLVRWTCQVGLIDRECADRILNQTTPSRARTEHRNAMEMREVLHRTFGSIADCAQPSERDIAYLNAVLKPARANQNFIPSDASFAWTWAGNCDSRSPIMLVALTAADLLERQDLARLKRCPGPDGCGWLFLDESRNRSRKWCSMDYCGNFAKARRFAENHPRPGG
jgi:predicted RNA-binding Zn ribbon-like protein